MKPLLLIFILALSIESVAGSLYTYEPYKIQMAAIELIPIHDGQLAKKTLIFDHIYPELKKASTDLATSVFFKYKDNDPENEFGHLYVCIKLNENGDLEAFEKDIKPKKIRFNQLIPEIHSCFRK
ncbi:MAG: hypothetical protein OEY89_08865 [Gammaproteobacteria bacterium]|nr:hypothetical protein [Gammaproteobacteria bacterium]